MYLEDEFRYRIIEPLGLEKTTKAIQSNHQPIPTVPTDTSLSATSARFLNTSKDGDSTPPWQSVPMPHHSSEKKYFLISNQNLPWHNLRPFPRILWLLPVEAAGVGWSTFPYYSQGSSQPCLCSKPARQMKRRAGCCCIACTLITCERGKKL